jgi:NAD(P)-dependent dehydrogenase (short-subunit alcohol dehydrogenase family)
MAEEGASVVVVDPGVNLDGSGNDAGPAEAVVSEIKANGGSAVPSLENVGTVDAGERIIQTALDTFGRLDILVNVAGILRDRMVFNMTPEEWQAVLTTHLKGHYCMIKPASILMRQQRYGRIINFSSNSGLVGNTGQANYGAAKAAIAGLTRVVARDLGRYGVTCNAISPVADTRMTATVSDQAAQARARAGIQGGAAAASAVTAARDPEYVAPMVCFLASDYAWNINGQIFGVSGGSISLINHPLAHRGIYKQGLWTLDELDTMAPQLLTGTTNPAPPAPDLDIPGRPKAEA